MRRLTFVNFATSVVKIGVMIILIYRWQLYGVIISSFVASVFEIGLLWYYLKDDYQFQYNSFKLLGAPLILLLMIVLIEPFIVGSLITIVHFMYGVVCAFVLWIAYRNELKLIIPSKLFK